ncbi:hypothetical protein AAE478_006507 [Parahypoxylon ruwenzoriense]
MAQVYRERDVRYTREHSPSSSDDEKYKTTTVRRYKVSGGGRVVERDRIERFEEDDDDHRSRHSHPHPHSHSHSHSHVGRSSGETLEVDRRVERISYPERPRSAVDSHDRYRTVEYERDRDHYPERHSYTTTRVIEETREASPHRDHYWDHHPWDDSRELDVRVDKRIVRCEPDGDLQVKEKIVEERKEEPRDYKERDIRIERRVVEEREPRDVDIERYRKEVEYYAPSPPPAPVIVRQKAPEQKVVINEAPAPAPVILPRQEPTYIILRDEHREAARRPEPREDDDYYHRRDDRRRREERQYESDGYDEDYYVKRTIITRDRSSSSDHHRKRHLAEGALAGAGLTALLAGRGGKDGEAHEHRGRKVLAGAALGALGTEVARRAKSAYDDRHEAYEGDHDDYHRHEHRSKSRSRIKTGLAIGAAALAVAGGLKYMQNSKAEKEEATRGRARRRYSDGEYSRSRSRSERSRSHSNSNMAKAALATGAIAGLVKHYRSKSRGKSGSKSRSKSRLRTGAEIAAAGLTGAAAEKLWEHHKEKKEHERHKESDDEYYDRDRSYTKSRSRSSSRSHSRNSHSRDSTADRELGLVPVIPGVEYGSEPIDGHTSATEESERRPRRRRRRSPSTSDQEAQKKRSRSRLREVAAVGLGTAAAAIGIKKYHDRQKSKERDENERPRENSRNRSLNRGVEDGNRERRKARRSRDRERRRYEEAVGEPYYNYDVEAPPPSPPHQSGGYPAPPGPIAPPTAEPVGFTQHSNPSNFNVDAYAPHPPYNPQDYVNLPPPPPGPPPSGTVPGVRPSPDNVSHPNYSGDSQSRPGTSRSTAPENDGLTHHRRLPSESQPMSAASESSPTPKVKFVPLSPKSSRTLRRHQKQRSADYADDYNHDMRLSSTTQTRDGGRTDYFHRPHHTRRRSGSDTSSNRPRIQRRRRRRDESPVSEDDEIEYLPDRFDASGRPLGTDNNNNSGTLDGIPRQGSFEYMPRDGNDWHIRGAWRTIGNPDPAFVSDIARTVGGLLHQGGSSPFLSILGRALRA